MCCDLFLSVGDQHPIVDNVCGVERGITWYCLLWTLVLLLDLNYSKNTSRNMRICFLVFRVELINWQSSGTNSYSNGTIL